MSRYLHGTAVLGVDKDKLFTPVEKQQFSEDYQQAVKAGLVIGSAVLGVLGAGLWSTHRVVGGILGILLGAPIGAVSGGVLGLYPFAKEWERRDRMQMSNSPLVKRLPAKSTRPDPPDLYAPW